MDTTDRLLVLGSLARSLRGQAHVLASRPSLLWQQLHATLAWETQPGGHAPLDAILERERARRAGPGAHPWLSPLKCPDFVGPVSATYQGHLGGVTACAPFPGGDRILSVGDDRTLRIWSARSGKCELTIDGLGARPSACAVSPSGETLLVGAADGTVQVWDAVGTRSAGLAGHAGGTTCCTFLGDGLHAASGGADSVVLIWDVAAGVARAALRGHDDAVTCCAGSSSGRLLASGGRDRRVCLWAGDGATSWTGHLLGEHAEAVAACAVSPDDRVVVSVGFDRMVRVWDAVTRTPLAAFEAHDDWILGCAFSPDGTMLATSSADGTVRTWDTRRWVLVGSTRAHEDWVNACAYSRDGASIVTASADGTLREIAVDEIGTGSAPRRHARTVHRCAISADGRLAATGSLDGAVLVWDAVNGTVIASFGDAGTEQPGRTDMLRALAFGPSGLLAWAQDDGSIRLWDSATAPTGVRALEGHQGAVRHVAFSLDGRLLAAAGDDGNVTVWDPGTGQRIAILSGLKRRVAACAVSADGALVAGVGGTTCVWRAHSGEVLHVFEEPGDSCAFSADGTLLAIGGEGRLGGGRVVIWRMPSGERIGALRVEPGSWALSPDSRSIMCGGQDGFLASWRIADVPFGTEVQFRESAFAREHAAVTFTGHRDWVNHCGFSASGRLVASASGNCYVPAHKDDSVRLWDAATGRQLCHWPAADAVACAAVSLEGDLLVYGDRAGNVGLLRVAGGPADMLS